MATEPLPQVEAALAELVALFEHWHQTRATVQERIRNRGILLDHGQILLDSDPKPAIDRYQALDLQRRNAQTAMLISPTRTAPEPTGSPAVIPEPASTADNDPDAETSPADRKEAAAYRANLPGTDQKAGQHEQDKTTFGPPQRRVNHDDFLHRTGWL